MGMMEKSRNKFISAVMLCFMFFSVNAAMVKGDPAGVPEMTNVTCEKSGTIFKTGDTFSFGFSLSNTTAQASEIQLHGNSYHLTEAGDLAMNDGGIYITWAEGTGYSDSYGFSADCFDKNSISVVRSGDHYTVSVKVKDGAVFRIENASVEVDVDGSKLSEAVGTFYFDDECYQGKHSYDEDLSDKINTEPTCEKAGGRSVKCFKCKSIIPEMQEITPASGHSWSEWSKVLEPSCTEEGKEERYCTNYCGKTETRTIAKLDHSWSEWSSVKKASVTGKGIEERVCKICNENQRETIPKLAATLKLGKTSVKLAKTKSVTLKAAFASGDTIAAKSSDKKIAKVTVSSNKINITAGKTAGTANITVKTKTGKKAVVKVTVPKAKTTKISCKAVKVKKGRKVALKPKVTPAYSDEKITFKSANRKIATVTSKGTVKGIKKGKTTITIKSGKKRVKVKVTVR